MSGLAGYVGRGLGKLFRRTGRWLVLLGIAAAVIWGAVRYLQKGPDSVAALRDAIISPAGTGSATIDRRLEDPLRYFNNTYDLIGILFWIVGAIAVFLLTLAVVQGKHRYAMALWRRDIEAGKAAVSRYYEDGREGLIVENPPQPDVAPADPASGPATTDSKNWFTDPAGTTPQRRSTDRPDNDRPQTEPDDKTGERP